MKTLGNKGDTIVEVLLSIVIVSSVLAGAYVSSSQSLSASRQAQERTEALKYVQTQIEDLKNATTTGSPSLPGAGFCFSTSNPSNTSSVTPNTDINIDNFSSYPNMCKAGSIPDGYNLSIVPSGTTYTVRARWYRADGNGKEEIVMVYKTD